MTQCGQIHQSARTRVGGLWHVSEEVKFLGLAQGYIFIRVLRFSQSVLHFFSLEYGKCIINSLQKNINSVILVLLCCV